MHNYYYIFAFLDDREVKAGITQDGAIVDRENGMYDMQAISQKL